MKKTLIPIVIGSIFFVAIAMYILLLKDNGDKPKSTVASDIAPVRNVAAEGRVEAMPNFDVEVGSELDGRVEEFFVNEGDLVKKGDLIAMLQNSHINAKLKEAETELSVARARLKEVEVGFREEEIERAKAALERATANLEFAKKDLQRHEELFKGGFTTKKDLENKEREFKVAKAKAKEAETDKILLEKGPKQETLNLYKAIVRHREASVEYRKRILEKTYITAPISGRVIRKYLQRGEIVSKGLPLVSIADTEKIRINAEIDETDVGRVSIGDPVKITSLAHAGKVFKGEVEDIAEHVGARRVIPNDPRRNLDMKVIQVKIRLKESTPFKLGMTVDVRIMPANGTATNNH